MGSTITVTVVPCTLSQAPICFVQKMESIEGALVADDFLEFHDIQNIPTFLPVQHLPFNRPNVIIS